jgi:hypothetical protein
MQSLQVMATPATAGDLKAQLGEADELVLERIVETRATVDEVAEALADLGDERQSGERREPPSTRVAEVRAILEEDLLDEGDDAASMFA